MKRHGETWSKLSKISMLCYYNKTLKLYYINVHKCVTEWCKLLSYRYLSRDLFESQLELICFCWHLKTEYKTFSHFPLPIIPENKVGLNLCPYLDLFYSLTLSYWLEWKLVTAYLGKQIMMCLLMWMELIQSGVLCVHLLLRNIWFLLLQIVSFLADGN